MIARIMKVDITPLPEALSPELKDLLKCILVSDPTKRPSIQQVMPARPHYAVIASLQKCTRTCLVLLCTNDVTVALAPRVLLCNFLGT